MTEQSPFGTLTPEALFAEITFIPDEPTTRRIQQHCVTHHCVAGIAYDADCGQWVWHTLYRRDGTKLEKESAEQYHQRDARDVELEADMMEPLAAFFAANGMPVDCFVSCAAGVADMVTQARDIVLEVKSHLTRARLYYAIGQVLLYRQAINPQARAVIVGRMTSSAAALAPLIAALGIEILAWEEVEARGEGQEARGK
jgi:hypothetical protein